MDAHDAGARPHQWIDTGAARVGVLLEQNIRHTLILSNGELAIFLRRPISGALLFLTVAVLAASALLSGRRALESVTPR